MFRLFKACKDKCARVYVCVCFGPCACCVSFIKGVDTDSVRIAKEGWTPFVEPNLQINLHHNDD